MEIPVVIHSLVNFDIVAVALVREERFHEKNWIRGCQRNSSVKVLTVQTW